MADDDAALATLVDQGSQAQAQSLDAHEVEVGSEQPASVVLAKARGLHQRRHLIVEAVGGEVGTGRRKHQSFSRELIWPNLEAAADDGRTAAARACPIPVAIPGPGRS